MRVLCRTVVPPCGARKERFEKFSDQSPLDDLALKFRVPVSALFRTGADWVVFAVKDGRARTTVVKLGQRSNRAAEVVSGLTPGDRVVLHPSDHIKEGVRVDERKPE